MAKPHFYITPILGYNLFKIIDSLKYLFITVKIEMNTTSEKQTEFPKSKCSVFREEPKSSTFYLARRVTIFDSISNESLVLRYCGHCECHEILHCECPDRPNSQDIGF